MRKNGKRYGLKSSDKYEVRRRAKRNNLTIEELLEKEKQEQDFLNLGLKFCVTCQSWKEFGKSAAYCKECCAKKSRSRYDKDKQRNYWLIKKFNISLDQYKEMLIAQDYKCYICCKSDSELDRSLAVDHCHATGKVRGLLCGNCNRFLGQIQDRVDIAKKLLEYLTIYTTQTN